MAKKIYCITLDCEACPIEPSEKVDPKNMLAYDLGFRVHDRQGNVIEEHSFVIYDIYVGESERMKSAYYANKLPRYEEDLKNGTRKMVRFMTAFKIFRDLCKKYNVTECYAHNMRFDFITLNTTLRWVTNGEYKYFFPKGMVICDTLKMSRQLIATMKSYKKFCEDNGFITKNNQVRLTAEILYKFISKNMEFVESHTGLEDVKIECEIRGYCEAKHKKVDRALWVA